MNLSLLKPIGLKILVDLVSYISENPENNIFEGYVFIQQIKTKKKLIDTELIDVSDFFEALEMFGVLSIPINPIHKNELEEAKESIQNLVCLDPSYKELLMIKKINNVVNQINGDTELLNRAKLITFTPLNESSPSPFKNQKCSDSEKAEGDSYDEDFIGDEVEKSKTQNSHSNFEKSPMKMDDSLDKDDDYKESFEEG